MQENSVRVIIYHLRKFIKNKKAKLEAAKIKKLKKGAKHVKKPPTYGKPKPNLVVSHEPDSSILNISNVNKSEPGSLKKNFSAAKNKNQKLNKTAEREKKPGLNPFKGLISGDNVQTSKLAMALKKATIQKMLDEIAKGLRQ